MFRAAQALRRAANAAGRNIGNASQRYNSFRGAERDGYFSRPWSDTVDRVYSPRTNTTDFFAAAADPVIRSNRPPFHQQVRSFSTQARGPVFERLRYDANTLVGGWEAETQEMAEPWQVRQLFSRAMSEMYGEEVPLYKDMVNIVEQINAETLTQHPRLLRELGTPDRVSEERHGAIRLGTKEELAQMKAVFAVMGMFPVGYYDLGMAGLPVHSTAFRPIDQTGLGHNPFRIFTSLLRLELLPEEVRKGAENILASRKIFSDRLLELVAINKEQGGLTEQQASEFVFEAIKTFKWHKNTNVSDGFYKRLHGISPLAADIVCFRGPHINHLTPRSLRIGKVHITLNEQGIKTIRAVQGPATRRHSPILLQQTSFTAIDEAVEFVRENGEVVQGTHAARFGEIEQRGVALTPKGREEYDIRIAKVEARAKELSPEEYKTEYPKILEQEFETFPDGWESLRIQGLAYFTYKPTQKGLDAKKISTNKLDVLIERGFIEAVPITYEDFLPVSAAGIFKSNLGKEEDEIERVSKSNQGEFEEALRSEVLNPFDIYASDQASSLRDTYMQLGIRMPFVLQEEVDRACMLGEVINSTRAA